MTTTELRTPPTAAQWAVRWAAVVLMAGLLLAPPLWHVVWHGVLGHATPAVRTRGQVPWPEPSRWRLANGSWMIDVERHLREASPVVWRLRGEWNELLYRVRALPGDALVFGREDWLFYRWELELDAAGFRQRREARLGHLRAVRDRLRERGCELLVAVVPDKARVYAEQVGDPALVAAKAPFYAELQADLREAGVATVDLAAAFAAARAAAPAEEFYFRRDTHWRPSGALGAGAAIAAAIEALPVAASLPPRQPVELGPRTSVAMLGDLTARLGLLAAELPGPDGRSATMPLSLLSWSLVEQRDYYGAVVRERPDGPPVAVGEAAAVWQVGTSFADENGRVALMLALGRPVHGITAAGASGLQPMAKALAAIAAAETPPRLVVWEIIERGFFEPAWHAPERP